MSKIAMTFRFDQGTKELLKTLAARENRTVTNFLETTILNCRPAPKAARAPKAKAR